MNDLLNSSCAACGQWFPSDLASDQRVDGPKPIGVALIEDSCLAREGIADLLARFRGFRIVAADSRASTSLLAEQGLDVVLLKIGARNDDTLEVVRALREGNPDLKIVLWDLPAEQEEMVDLVTAGVGGFVLKDAPLEDIIRTMRSVAAGWTVIPTSLTRTLRSEITSGLGPDGGHHEPGLISLTQREREVVHLIGEGLSNKVISRRLGISVHTVKSHLRNVMDKLSVHSRLQIARFVHENKVV